MAPFAIVVFVVGAGAGAGVVIASHSGHSGARTVRALPPPVHRPPARRALAARPRAQPAGLEAGFAQLEHQLDGAVGLAAAPLRSGPIVTLGPAQIAHAWSTSKVPVLATLLSDYERRDQSLDPQQRAYAAAALEQSDNAAIEALFGDLETIQGGLIPASAAVQQLLRKAGDEETVINTAPNSEGFTTYGQTEWSLSGEVTFYRALADGCLLSAADTGYVLGLMRQVIPSESWGAGSAGYPASARVAFKGGWGPENGRYQVRQTAIISSGDHSYVISMLALPASGSFDDGTSMLTALASWARRNLTMEMAGPGPPCPATQH